MELFPAVRLGWINGWILLAVFYTFYVVCLLLFPKAVVQRLYERSSWTKEQRTLNAIGFPFALVALGLIILSPLKVGHPTLTIGLGVYSLGFIGFVNALFNFKNAQMDQPITDGLYKFSRNPQWVSFALTLVGASVAVGSLATILLLFVRIILTHFRILGEEKSCLKRYGDAYHQYMKQVPRYLLFF